MKEALKLALEALEYWDVHGGLNQPTEEAITAIKAALAQPEQPKVRTGDCLLVGVCASEGHKIQVKQEPWRESASDYERGVIDGRQMQAQSSVDKAVNRMAQEQEPWCMKMNGCKTKCEDCPVEVAQQEPVAKYSDIVSDGGLDPRNKFDAPPQPEERNFCPRCGKRTADLTVIHTCTPPQRKPLTDDEIWKFWCSRPEVSEGEDDSMEAEFVTAVRAVLAAHNIKENT